MELIKQIIESIGNFLKIFTKETNKVKVFFVFAGLFLIFGLFYYLHSSQIETEKLYLEREKLTKENEKKLIEEIKNLKENTQIGGNVNGNVGDNNQTTNQTNSGGIIANSKIENSSVNIVNLVLSEYTKYSSGELYEYITEKINDNLLSIDNADEIIKQVSNIPADSKIEKQQQEDLINTLFQKFSFDTNGKTSWVRFKAYVRNSYDNYNYYGCNLQIEKIEPFYKNEKFFIKIIFGTEKPKENDSCLIFLPKEITIKNPKNTTGFYFYGNTATNLEETINYSEKYSSGLSLKNEEPLNFSVILEGKENLRRGFSLNDTKTLNIKYNYTYIYQDKHQYGNKIFNKNGYFIWKIDEKYGVSLVESK